MQKVLKQAVSVALAVGLLAGCASEEDTIQMAPLPVVEEYIYASTGLEQQGRRWRRPFLLQAEPGSGLRQGVCGRP